MALVILPNQRFPIPDELLVLANDSQQAKDQRDARIRRIIGQYAPAALNATLTYEKEGETSVVRVTPKLSTKASSAFDQVHETFITSHHYIDPALALAWEIKWRYLTHQLNPVQLLSYRSRIEQMLKRSARPSQCSLDDLHTALSKAEGILPHEAPTGF